MKRVGQMLNGSRFLLQESLGWALASPSVSPRLPLLRHLPGCQIHLEQPRALETSVNPTPAWSSVPPAPTVHVLPLWQEWCGFEELCQMFSDQIPLREGTCWGTNGTAEPTRWPIFLQNPGKQPTADGGGIECSDVSYTRRRVWLGYYGNCTN